MNRQTTHFVINAIILLLTCALPALAFKIDNKKEIEKLLASDNPTIHLSKDCSDSSISQTVATKALPKKNWTFIVYMAADNDLRAFAGNNIKQMASIGSNNNLNIAVHLDMRLNVNQKITRRYYVEKNKLTQFNQNDSLAAMDSGNPQTLISACDWAIKNFPAQHYALILWNHGTGVIDPKHYKILNPAELFLFNPKTKMMELDRSIGFLEFLSFIDTDLRGICWDNTTGNYLTNQKLEEALKEVCTNSLRGKKFDLIAFDACLMSMLEIASIIKKYALFMVGSQEVELGTGWNYSYVLQPLNQGPCEVAQLAQHIVGAYCRSYQNITNDFTQSAIDLNKVQQLENNVDIVSKLLLQAIQCQQNSSVTNAIRASKNRKNCTHFDEPSYIDLNHFYSNLKERIQACQVTQRNIINDIQTQLDIGKKILSQVVCANIAGDNLKQAAGLSIYFPEQQIHPSYPTTEFAQKNQWSRLIHYCK